MRECEKKYACQFRDKDDFSSSNDYYQFLKEISGRVNFYERNAVKNRKYSHIGFVEKFYQCTLCNKLWRLVEPDPPFAGVWQRVEDV